MRFLSYLGKFLISVGVGVLLFVGWTLKGTDLITNGHQRRLAEEFQQAPELEPVITKGQGGGGGGQGGDDEPLDEIAPPDDYLPGPSEGVFTIAMPDVTDKVYTVVEGVGVEDLKEGPGHYPSCRPGFEKPLCTDFEEVFPGENGRVIVSGHRTTYGAPFWAINEFENGDEITIDSKWGDFVYEVYDMRIVEPDDLSITVRGDSPELVLTTCNPRFSAAERLIVFARLKEATPS